MAALSILHLLTTGSRRTAGYPDLLHLPDRTVPLIVREHPSTRRIVMRLAPGGGAIRLTVPRRTSAKLVLAFLDRHRGWAESRLAALPPALPVGEASVIPFRGAPLRIVHRGGRRASRLEPAAAGGGEARLLLGGDAPHLARRVADFLKREARRDLQVAVARHSAALGLAPTALVLKDTRSRWGSCTRDRRLAFSWRVVMAPPAVLDYLAAHEVAHFREMNHGPAFWALCRDLCPDMDAGRNWLKREGSSLHAVDFASPHA